LKPTTATPARLAQQMIGLDEFLDIHTLVERDGWTWAQLLESIRLRSYASDALSDEELVTLEERLHVGRPEAEQELVANYSDARTVSEMIVMEAAFLLGLEVGRSGFAAKANA
jgi:hypothetical protein